MKTTISGMFEVLGWVLLVVAVFALAAMFFQPGPRVMAFALASLTSFLSALFLLGFSELLRRLTEIRAELRRITGSGE